MSDRECSEVNIAGDQIQNMSRRVNKEPWRKVRRRERERGESGRTRMEYVGG